MSELAALSTRPSPFYREIPATARPGMAVPVRVYADEPLWEQISRDRSVDQLVNVAMLPGVTGFALGMPDMHEGYGFPVGGVAAMRERDGVISPGGVGYDINCGVRLLVSSLLLRDCRDRIEPLVHELSRSIPSGMGKGTTGGLSDDELDQVLARGCRYLEARGWALPEDVAHTEAHGSLERADPTQVSDRAKARGRNQLGTIGSGNHFVEVQVVDAIAEPAAAEAMGLRLGGITVLVHTGSRGLGHQVCTDYVRTMDRVMPGYGITLPDRQLACAPLDSKEGKAYFGAMCAAANFAWSNRQMIAHRARQAFRDQFGEAGHLRLIYDVAHNIAKLEDHGGERVCVHRKGATRALGPSHPETPAPFRAVGQPVFIPGSMGTASWVLAGTDESSARSFGSSCHGAGRAMSRSAAKRRQQGHEVRQELEAHGIVVRCASNAELAEEAPFAYKDVDRVVDVVDGAGLARKVARLRPVGVIKG